MAATQSKVQNGRVTIKFASNLVTLQIASPEASNTPIFWGHGTADPLVKPKLMNMSVEYLVKELGFSTTTKNEYKPGIACNLYDGIGHTTNQEELDDLKAWLANALPKI